VFDERDDTKRANAEQRQIVEVVNAHLTNVELTCHDLLAAHACSFDLFPHIIRHLLE
tara:strand:- start:42 stop:212 length:171 start_codon:yes stop_codon:yes gene_type:complete